ncbi:MAG: hypothetical protein NTZ80_00250, partial [Patescibacteria group bacterium]|nr:hypothetical protein [Patescibacteria group bacterium]
MGKSRDSRPGDSRHSNERGSESEQDKPQEAPKLSALENVWTEYQKYEKLLSGLRERIAGTQNQNLKAYLEGAADGLIMTNQRLQKKLDEESIKTVDSALAKVSGSLKNMPENKKRILRALSTEDVKEVCGVKSPVSETLEILKVLESMSEKDKEILKSANCAGATKYLELLSSIEPVEIIIREIEPVFRNPDTKIKMAQETYALRVEAFNQEIRKRISDADADPEIFAKEVSSQEKWFKNEKRDFWMLVSLSPYNDGAKNILQEDILELYRLFENRLNIVSEQAKYVTDLTRLKASTDEIKNNLRNKEKITDENEIRKFFLNSEELLIGSYNYLQSLEKLHFELRTNSVIDELKENIEQSHLEIICRMYNLYWFFAMIPEFPSLVGRQEHPNVKWAGSQLKRLATLLPMTGDYVIGEQKKFEIERAFMDERRKQQKARVTVFVSRPKSNAGQNVSEKTDAQVQDDIESIIEKESCPNNSIIFAEEAINDNGKSVYFYHDVNWQRLAKSFEMLTELSEPDLSLQNQIRSGLDLYKQMVELYTKKRELRNEEKIAKCLENYQTDRSLILNRLCRLVERARLKIHPNKIPDISDDDIAEFESISALAEPMLSWKADPSLSGCKNSNFQAERIEEQKQEYKNIAEEIKKVIQWQRAAKEMDKIYKERIEKADPEGITLDEINSIKNDLNRMSENSVEFKELASIKKIFDQLEKLIEQKILVMMKAANVDMDTINKIDPQAIGLYELYLAREDLDELVDEMQVLVDDPRLFPPIEEIYKKLDSLEKEAMKNFGFQAKEIGREIELNDNPSDFIKNDINKIIAILAESLEKEVEGLNENSSIEEVSAIRSKNSILESCTSRAVWIERGIIEKNDQTLAAAEIGCVLREIEEYTVDDSDELEKNIGDLDGFAEEINQIAGGEKDLLWIALLRIKTAIDKKMKLQEFLGHLAALLDKKQNPNLEPHPSGNPKWQAEADKILTEMKEYDPSKHLNDEIFYKDAEKWFNEVQRLIRQNEAKDDNKATELIKTLDILINTLAERRTAKKIELLKLHRRLSVLLNKKQSNASEEVSALSSGAEMHSQTPGVTFSQSEGREKEKEPHAASQLPVAVGIKDLPAEAFNICLNNLARQLIEKIEGLVISLDDPEQIKGIAEEYEKLHSIAGIEKTNGENRMLVLKDVRDLLVKKLQAIAAAHTVREDLVNDMYIYNPNIVFGDDARVEDLDKISDALKEFSRRIENMINRNLADLSYVEEQRKALLAKKNEIVKKLLNPVQQIADGYSE